MHYNNVAWLKSLKARFPEAFTRTSVLEVGSVDPEGKTRSFFEDCDYIGIDLVDGPNVDIVGDFNDYHFARSFDTVVLLSVFEHTPHWRHILQKAIALTKNEGYIIVSFGPEGNNHHLPEPWQPVVHKDFLAEVCAYDGVSVSEAFFEPQMFWPGDIRCFDALLRKAPLVDGSYVWQGPDPSLNYYPPTS